MVQALEKRGFSEGEALGASSAIAASSASLITVAATFLGLEKKEGFG